MSPFERLRGAHLTNHPVLEDLVFSVLSFLVMIVAATAIMAQSDPRIVAVAAPGGGPPGKQIELYGTLVDENGQPLSGATIELAYAKNNKIASTTTNANGEFIIRFNEAISPYTLTVRTPQGTASTTLDLTGGLTWGIQVTMIPPSSWVFVPLPGY